MKLSQRILGLLLMGLFLLAGVLGDAGNQETKSKAPAESVSDAVEIEDVSRINTTTYVKRSANPDNHRLITLWIKFTTSAISTV